MRMMHGRQTTSLHQPWATGRPGLQVLLVQSDWSDAGSRNYPRRRHECQASQAIVELGPVQQAGVLYVVLRQHGRGSQEVVAGRDIRGPQSCPALRGYPLGASQEDRYVYL